jgi:hypothetical protein
MRDMASGSGDPAYTASMSEADSRFREALRIDLQRLLGEGIVVRGVTTRATDEGRVEAVAVVKAGERYLRFTATGDTIVEAYGRLVTDSHPERIPAQDAP